MRNCCLLCLLWAHRAAQRASVMRARVAAVEEREAQRRIRREAMGQQAAAAGGPDMGAFMSQLETKGYGQQQQQQQQQQHAPGSHQQQHQEAAPGAGSGGGGRPT
jgi:hypothetical protein